VPRQIGERDWAPLALTVCGALACIPLRQLGILDGGVVEALAVARPATALLLGLGLAGAAGTWGREKDSPVVSGRRAALWLGLPVLLVFGHGCYYLYQAARAPERSAASQVARFALEEMGEGGRLLAIGPRGLPVACFVGQVAGQERVRITSTDVKAATADLGRLVAGSPGVPRTLVVSGNRHAVDGSPGLGSNLGASIEQALSHLGYERDPDGHRFLGNLMVAVWRRVERSRLEVVVDPGELAPAAKPR
jgi:hypothetical protein